MRSEETLLAACLRAFLEGRPCEVPDSPIDWAYFYHLARTHYVGGMVYLALKTSTDLPLSLLPHLKHLFDFTVSCSVRRKIQTQEAEQALCQAQIPHIYFKGQELCRYYPVPEVRLMSDVDILIRRQDGRKVEDALEKAGFTQKSKSINGYVYEKNQILLEIHTAFASGVENGADFRTWSMSGFENSLFPDNGYTGYFRPPYHFLYLIYHTAKHFNSTGAGIRMFLDLAVFWKHYADEISPEKLRENLKKMGLDRFADAAFWLCNHWFGTDIPLVEGPDPDLQKFMEDYIFSGGVYGHQKRSFSDLYIRKAVTDRNMGQKYRQKLKSYVHFFFPGRKAMEAFLPGVRSHLVLLPAAWIIRWYQGFFHRRKSSLRSLRRIGQGNPEAEREYKMLQRLGLIR